MTSPTAHRTADRTRWYPRHQRSFKTGARSRLIYRPRVQGHLRGDHRGFTWQNYRDLVVRAHLQLGGPSVVIWDNCENHGAPSGPGYDPWDNWPRLPC